MPRTLESDTELGIMWPRSGSRLIHVLGLTNLIISTAFTMAQAPF